MTPERWELVQSLFLLAADLPPSERDAVLREQCPDADVRHEVASLLSYDQADAPLIVEALQKTAQSLLIAGDPVGLRLGPWRVLREIGRGGMGTVYLAERDDGVFRRKAAIKIVTQGMDTAEMLDRFRRERQILASLDHPYIARLIDGGSTPDGRPFLVMEYVEGQPIHHYCRDHALDVEERCRLFVRVCAAVSHAHRNLVVHRDLKPGNILITADGAPKLLDFGVAKLLDPTLDPGLTMYTSASGRMLTPEYASPEQVRGGAVNTVSDVYSLGAILYELLTGAKAHRMQANTAAEVERAICLTEVTRPSTAAIESLGRRWQKTLRGDLDNIILKAMRKEPERRYASVEHLAEDLRRHLEHQPVQARKDSLSYRSVKFIRRHRVALAGVSLVVISLAAGLFVALAEARRAEHQRLEAVWQRSRAEEQSRRAESAQAATEVERARATVEAERARAERNLAQQRLHQIVELANRTLFDTHDDLAHLPGAMAARRRMVATTLGLLEKLSQQADKDQELQISLAVAYERLGDIQCKQGQPNLGDVAGGRQSYQRALALLKPLRAKQRDRWAVKLAWVEVQHGLALLLPSEQMLVTLQQGLPEAQELARMNPGRWESATLVGLYYSWMARAAGPRSLTDAKAYAQKYLAAVQGLEQRFPENAAVIREIANAYLQVGTGLLADGQLSAARDALQQATLRSEALYERQPEDLIRQQDLANTYRLLGALYGAPYTTNLGNPAEARQYYQKAIVIQEKWLRADPQNRDAWSTQAGALWRLGAIPASADQNAERLQLLTHAQSILNRLIAERPDSERNRRELAWTNIAAGDLRRATGQTAEALKLFHQLVAETLATIKRVPGQTGAYEQWFHAQRGIVEMLAETGRLPEAATAGLTLVQGTRAQLAAHPALGQEAEWQLRIVEAELELVHVRTLMQDWPTAAGEVDETLRNVRSLARVGPEWTAAQARATQLLSEIRAHFVAPSK